MEVGAVAASRAPGRSRVGSSASVELLVSGMHCQSGAALIEETLVRDPASIDRQWTSTPLGPGDLTTASISVEDLCAAIASVGYTASPLSSGDPASSC